jgi:hypothetical protein
VSLAGRRLLYGPQVRRPLDRLASARPEALLKEIRQKAFPRFDFVETKIENGCYWAHLRPSSV